MSGDESSLRKAMVKALSEQQVGWPEVAGLWADIILALPELQALRRDAEIGRWVRENEAETQPYLAYAGTTDELRVIRSAQMFRSKAIAAGDAKPPDGAE